ncbi:cytochrome p450 [Colletotrichum sojae]|uniref:Cytochrome p450 n=1 Tax=Colletotrichum sojae TaxID=2175907 RepID=A0A8H6JET5_9PEZI|nr:cytochrome p450 [Colletotrichum sojae]
MLLADPSVAAYAGLSLLTILTIYLLHKAETSPLRHVPGPFYTLITHLPLKYHVLAGRRMHFVHALHARHGPVVRISPTEVAISSPDGFAAIHRVGGAFLKSSWYAQSTKPPDAGPRHETSLFAMTDPKQHAQRRKLLSRVFTKHSLRRDWEPAVREKVILAVERMRSEAEKGGRCNVLRWWTMMATDVISHLAFGESFGMLARGEKNDYVRAVELTAAQNTLRYELPMLNRLMSWLPESLKPPRGPDAQLVLREYGRRAVAGLRSKSDADGAETKTNLFKGVLDAAETGEKEWLTEAVVEADAKSMIFAGSETTAVTLTYIVWAVLKRPELRARLEDELGALDPNFDDAKLEGLPLLKAVIDETMRLYAAVPGQLQRVVPPGGANLGGYSIPGGTLVETQAYTLHRDPDVWADPLRFDETRFLDPQRLTPRQKLLFCPWGAGPRICLGIELAKMELRLAVAELFRRCEGLRLAPETTDAAMEMENYFVMCPVGHKCEVTLP